MFSVSVSLSLYSLDPLLALLVSDVYGSFVICWGVYRWCWVIEQACICGGTVGPDHRLLRVIAPKTTLILIVISVYVFMNTSHIRGKSHGSKVGISLYAVSWFGEVTARDNACPHRSIKTNYTLTTSNPGAYLETHNNVNLLIIRRYIKCHFHPRLSSVVSFRNPNIVRLSRKLGSLNSDDRLSATYTTATKRNLHRQRLSEVELFPSST